MDKFYNEFMELFSLNRMDDCVVSAMEEVQSGRITIPVLYEKILVPALYSIDDCPESDPGCIWDEHVKTSIIRTIIEVLYPIVIDLGGKAEKTGDKIVLTCPEKEYHEVGLRMMSDFFQINGYQVIYIGSNTPRDQVWQAIRTEKPNYVGISVTDYYLLFEAKRIVEKIKTECVKDIKIILGGQAFRNNPHTIEEIGGDIYIQDYNDVLALREGENQ
ncbi:cobalamin B12-binding domain-containing protein [Gudongella sp. DL1XJH-153]|uniref:cobalamin B12-binding domain-containing protein n=1 Tax=Gudongella sp. DL1XJH-153 TaxID=3409804 RepID=UPI003BB57CEE